MNEILKGIDTENIELEFDKDTNTYDLYQDEYSFDDVEVNDIRMDLQQLENFYVIAGQELLRRKSLINKSL